MPVPDPPDPDPQHWFEQYLTESVSVLEIDEVVLYVHAVICVTIQLPST